MNIKHKDSGFTLVEILVVIIIISILSVTISFAYSHVIEKAKSNADESSVHTLNVATGVYKFSSLNSADTADVFAGIATDAQRIQALIDSNSLLSKVTPQQKNAQFCWLIPDQLWSLKLQSDEPPLTPLGSTFQEISTAMIDLIIQRFEETGGYGRTWGDHRYTDIGLNPDDWKGSPINHISYVPSGGTLRIDVEDGYSLFIDDINGVKRELTGTSNWSLIYNNANTSWYFHSIKPENKVLIETIVLP